MEKIKFLKFATAMMLCCAFTMISCDKDDDDNTANLKFSSSKVEAVVGAANTITVSGGTEPYTAVSSDAKIATVSVAKNVITVTGVKTGSALISVIDKNKLSGKINVTVKAATEGLTFDKSAASVAVGKEDAITIKGGTAPYVLAVKDATIATASESNGKITVKGVKAGTTTLTVTDKNKKSGTITITVK